MGVESSSWGGSWGRMSPFSSRWTAAGFFPRKVLVSMGSRRGSMGGLVTWEAFKRSLSQYTGYALGVAHAGEEHPAAGCLAVHLLDGLARPVGVLPEGVAGLHDLQGLGGAQGHAPVAGHALSFVRKHLSSGPRRSGGPRWRTGARTPGRRCTGRRSGRLHILGRSIPYGFPSF